MSIELTREFLLSKLVYDPETGLFQRIMKKKKGLLKPAGCLNTSHGKTYVMIKLHCKAYAAHRLAWMYVHGELPDKEVDHIDGDSINNRISNLRLATRQENAKNMRRSSPNSNGCCGVYWSKLKNKWEARIKSGYKNKLLGYFDNKDDAVKARKDAELEHGFHPNHGMPMLSKMKELQGRWGNESTNNTIFRWHDRNI